MGSNVSTLTWTPKRGWLDSLPDILSLCCSVHYLKADLTPAAAAAIARGDANAALIVEHPHLRARAELGRATLASLAQDLAEDLAEDLAR